MESASGEPLDERPLVRAEPRRLPGGGILRHPLGTRRRGYRDRAALIAQDPLEERLAPGLDAVLAERLELAGRWRTAYERAAAERSHDEDADAELLGEREDLALDLSLVRVVRDLDRLDAPGPHDCRELAEGGRAVVRRARQADDTRLAELLD